MICRVRKRGGAPCTACNGCGGTSCCGKGPAGSRGSCGARHGSTAMHAAHFLFLVVSMVSIQPGIAFNWMADGAAVLPQQGPPLYEAAVAQLAAEANLSTDPVSKLAKKLDRSASVCCSDVTLPLLIRHTIV